MMFVASWCLLRLTESWSNQIDRKTWQRMISWKDTEPGAAPPFQSRLSAGSVGSGCSVWPGGWALPPACWTQSGNVMSACRLMCENKYSEMNSVPSIHILSVFSGAHLCSAVIWPKMRLPSPTPHLMANSLLRSTVTRQRSLFTTLLRDVVKKIKVPYYICFNIFW